MILLRKLPKDGRSRSGFTLIEVIVMCGIVAILTTMYMGTSAWAHHRAMVAVFQADMRMVKLGAQRFEQDLGVYPPDVVRGIDPGMIDKYGWQAGDSSGGRWAKLTENRSEYERQWSGPYIDWHTWKRNPWGGLYDWDNYEPTRGVYMGIPGGAVYVTLKPSTWGGKDGLPPPQFEDILEATGFDISPWPYVVAARIGQYPFWNNFE
ncbi:MAG: prepilin-type N-terminal cleavage/methylation domain-containing protein [Deltaproteobacteria bacterium]|nr:prepilin-type N-terminal cleavage/methylation domain-containing protein [bacterium]MCB9477279.1 prepilin-type N-terminal cleavage/methylation domain-containing protein [Deltaproteobacteria bacterium]MCB9478745.1 prepilin-type N-terminal cleavage/methylation domain-containing protein [Deltaproteobacteria bacterium]MCB9488261.1 prepilin-type N-terminal cleavage/methylation domain-containing protein [Deltaproteobacteria bacterium]